MPLMVAKVTIWFQLSLQHQTLCEPLIMTRLVKEISSCGVATEDQSSESEKLRTRSHCIVLRTGRVCFLGPLLLIHFDCPVWFDLQEGWQVTLGRESKSTRIFLGWGSGVNIPT